MEYFVSVQCPDMDGRPATFIRSETREQVSPSFPSLAELYPWMRANGWQFDELVNGKFLPWRVSQVVAQVAQEQQQ